MECEFPPPILEFSNKICAFLTLQNIFAPRKDLWFFIIIKTTLPKFLFDEMTLNSKVGRPTKNAYWQLLCLLLKKSIETIDLSKFRIIPAQLNHKYISYLCVITPFIQSCKDNFSIMCEISLITKSTNQICCC